MGVSPDRWRKMSMEMRTVGLVSTTPREDLDRAPEKELPADAGIQPDRICERRQLKTRLDRAIGMLPARYQKVVFLYYTNDMTMKEIGEMLGVNESRISQIHKLALKKMAECLQSEGIASAAAL